jgi:hypothetical protein
MQPIFQKDSDKIATCLTSTFYLIHLRLSLTVYAGLLLITSMGAQTEYLVNAPVVDTLDVRITDSVYMATHGSDQNPGTRDLPVRTFSRALDRLPFGTAGINNGHRYGLVIIMEGHYQENFVQNESQWRQNNVYKNVSLRGEGKVTIGGTAQTPVDGHLMIIRGSHIYIRNIQLQYTLGIGLLLPGPPGPVLTQTDILLEDVSVDSVAGHGMLLSFVSKVRADRVSVRHANGYEPPVPPYPCRTWPSGFKPYMSSHVEIRNSLVARNWGEGINFHNCTNGRIHACTVHDNYGSNLYNDNSSKLTVSNNLIFNTPDQSDHWRGCYGYEGAPTSAHGISIANERSCPNDLGYLTNRTIDCQLDCVHPILGTTRLSTVDSMLIFNNILLSTGSALSVWEGVTELATACMSNIWFVHNTCIGISAHPDIRNISLVNFNFGSGVNLAFRPLSSIRNVTVAQNLFSFRSTQNPQVRILRRVLDPIFPAPFQVAFVKNSWNQQPDAFGMNAGSRVHPEMPDFLLPGDIDTWDTELWRDFQSEGDPFSFAHKDFFDQNRTQWVQGAIEYASVGTVEDGKKQPLRIAPNPVSHTAYMYLPESNHSGKPAYYYIFGAEGRVYRYGEIITHASEPVELNLADLTPGTYWLVCWHGGKRFSQFLQKL